MARKKVVVLGAGISGLTAAYYLKKRFGDDVDLTVIEKRSEPGGWIRSIEDRGLFFELGPRSLRTKGSGQATLTLVEELGAKDSVVAADAAAQRRYLWVDGKLQDLPTNPFSAALSPLTRPALGSLLLEPFRPRGNGKDESIYEFTKRRLSRYVAETFLDPLTTGIFAGDIRRLSMRSCFPTLVEWEQAKGSILRGALFGRRKKPSLSPWVEEMQRIPLISFKQGMAFLPKVLHQNTDADWAMSESLQALEFHQDHVRVHSDRRCIEADEVVSALPPLALAPLVKGSDSRLGTLLHQPRAASLVVISLGYLKSCLPVRGFGYLVPSREKEAVMGVVFDSCTFPQHNRNKHETRLTVMMGGTHSPELVQEQDDTCLALAKQALAKHLGITSQPDLFRITRIRQGIPQYEIGHEELVTEIRQRVGHRFPRLHLLGNFFDGISVNDCVANAKAFAESLSLHS